MFRTKTAAMGFAVIVAILFTISAFGLYQLNAVSQHVENILRHPFAVSNATRAIEFNLVAMHRSMKDVVLASNADQRSAAITLVDAHEADAFEKFELIFDRFLGQKRQVQDTYKAFVDWKPIRDEVITLTEMGRKQEAAEITKSRGAEHLDFLYAQTQALVEFATNKAAEFSAKAESKRQHAVLVLSSAATGSIVLAIFVSVSVIRSMQRANRESARQHHLIDQHIMTATLDKDGMVKDASNALCRFLEVEKEKLLETPSHFFDHSETTQETEEKIRLIIQSGQPWQGEIKRASHDGSMKWAQLSIIPNVNDSYDITNFSAILNDTTSNKLSGRDKLTSLYNRRRFDEVAERELAVARRHDRGITLAILDIDHFKAFNDAYGHPAGDEALTQVAGVIRNSLRRPDDYAFRIGGEEFAMIIADQDRTQSQLYMDDIRQAIQDLKIAHSGNSVANVLTVSIGICVALKAEHDVDELYALADEALYRAKETRNRVSLHSYRPVAAVHSA